jgi:hypothetical protein
LAHQEVQNPIAEKELFSPRVKSLVKSLEGTMVLNAGRDNGIEC